MTRHHSTHKARKPWTCSGCGRSIQPGDTYRYSYEPGGTNERHDCAECAPEYATEFDPDAECWFSPGGCGV